MHVWVVGKDGLVGSVAAQKASIATSRKEVDILDLAAVSAFLKSHPEITHIINCAAVSLVDLAETKREEAYAANAIGPENLAIGAQEAKIHLTHLSTDYVYPGDVFQPLKETDPTAPCNYYGETKLEGEKRVLQVLPSATIVRTSWVFGNGERNLIGKLIDLFKAEKTVRLADDHWGRPTFAEDLVEILFQLRNTPGIYHFANQGITSKYLFGMKLFEQLKQRNIPLLAEFILPVPSSTFPSLAKRPPYSAFNTEKIERTLSLSIRSWEDAMHEFLCSKFGH